MAEHVDGSIVVDTKIDDKGFEAGSSELLAAIKSLTQEIKQLGTTIQTTFSSVAQAAGGSDTEVEQLKARIAELEGQVQTLKSAAEELQRQLDATAGQQVVNPAASEEIEKLKTRISELEGQLNALTSEGAQNQPDERIAELEAQVRSLQEQIDQLNQSPVAPQVDTSSPKKATSDIQKEIDKLNSDIDKLGPMVKRAEKGSEAAIDQYVEKSEKADDSLARLKQRVEAFGKTKIPTKEYELYSDAVMKVEARLHSLYERQAKLKETGVKENSRQWRSLQYDIEKAEQEIDKYNERLTNLEKTGGAFTLGKDTDQYKQYTAEIAKAESKLQDMDRDFAQATKPASRLKSIMSGIGGAVKKIGSLIRTGLINGLKAAGRGAKTLVSGVLKVAKAMTGLGHKGKSASDSIAGGFRNILKYAFGIRSLFILVNKLRSGLVEGFQNLAQYSDKTNGAISSIMSSLTRLKNSFATAFNPILTVVAPYLSRLIDMLSVATTRIGMFFAAMTGAKTFTRAKAVQQDYAASLSKTADSADDAADAEKNAAKEAKKAEKQLASFDSLNILSQNKSSDKDSSTKNKNTGTKDTGLTPQDMFEEVPIESKIADFAKRLKDLFANGEFAEIGRLLGEQINGLFSKIKSAIEYADSVIIPYVKAFCEIFNGMVGAIDWDLIGSTFAAGINLLIHIAYTLLTGIDWELLGRSLGEGLTAMVRDIDWAMLGETLALYMTLFLRVITSAILAFDWDMAGQKLAIGINSFVSTVDRIITGIDWKGIGAKFASGVNHLISDVDWGNLGKTLGDLFNSALYVIFGAVTTFDWVGAGKAFADGFNGLAESIDWAALGQTLSTALIGALDFLRTAIAEVDWYQIGKDVETFLINIDWAGVCASLFGAIGAALGGLSALLWGIIEDAWNEVIDWWNETAFEDGHFTIQGLLDGIADALASIGTWIYDHVFKPFIDGFKEAFGIHSPSKVMEEQGGFLIDGLLNGVSSAWKNIKSFFTEKLDGIKKKFSDAWGNIKKTVSDASSNISKDVKDKFGNVATTVSDKVGNVKKAISDRFGDSRSIITDTAGSIYSTVKEKFSGMADSTVKHTESAKAAINKAFTAAKSTVSSISGTIHSTVSSKFSSVASAVSSKMSSVQSTVSSKFNSVKSSVTSAAGNIYSTMSSKFSSISSTVSSKMSTMASAVSSKISGVKTTLTSNMQTAYNSLKNMSWSSIGSSICSGIQSGINAGWSWLSTTVSNLAWNLLNAAETALGINSPSKVFRDEVGKMLVKGAAVGVEQTIPEAVKAVRTMADRVTEEVNDIDGTIALGAESSGLDDTLTTFADKVSDSFTALMDRLETIATRVTFATPAIVDGGITPYSIRQKATGGGSGGLAETLEASNEELGSVVIQAVTNATSAIVDAIQRSGGDTYLDGDKITTKVIEEVNRRTIMGGKPVILT